MALTAFHLQVAGLVILAAVAVAAFWWLIRAAMGWHSGRALYWLNQPADDDHTDDNENDDGGADPR